MAMLKVVINLLLLALVMVHTSTGAPPFQLYAPVPKPVKPPSYQHNAPVPEPVEPPSYQHNAPVPKPVAPPLYQHNAPVPQPVAPPFHQSYMSPPKVAVSVGVPPKPAPVGVNQRQWYPSKNDEKCARAQLGLLSKTQSHGVETVTYASLKPTPTQPLPNKGKVTWLVKRTFKVNKCTQPGNQPQPHGMGYKNAKPQGTYQGGYQGTSGVNTPVVNNKNCLQDTVKECVLTTTTGPPCKIIKIECPTPKTNKA